MSTEINNEAPLLDCGFHPTPERIDRINSSVKRLLDLASRGGPAGSGGEQRARRLVKLVSKAIEDCADTDYEAVEGAAALLCLASSGGNGYCWVRDVLDANGYRKGGRS
jgi:hypothetical protein